MGLPQRGKIEVELKINPKSNKAPLIHRETRCFKPIWEERIIIVGQQYENLKLNGIESIKPVYNSYKFKK